MADAVSPRRHQYVGQHCWASQPLPDKYAFQATDKQTNRQTEGRHRRVNPWLLWQGLKNRYRLGVKFTDF